MRAQKVDPEKNCNWCGEPLARKRFSTGRLEDRGRFLKRMFCDKACQASAQVDPTSTNKQTMLSRSAKHRKAACERCGVTTRLHVHHKDEDRTNNDPTNLETLCVLCHNRHHFLGRSRTATLGSGPSETRSSHRLRSGSGNASSSTKEPQGD